jgi:hypothetical protein
MSGTPAGSILAAGSQRLITGTPMSAGLPLLAAVFRFGRSRFRGPFDGHFFAVSRCKTAGEVVGVESAFCAPRFRHCGEQNFTAWDTRRPLRQLGMSPPQAVHLRFTPERKPLARCRHRMRNAVLLCAVGPDADELAHFVPQRAAAERTASRAIKQRSKIIWFGVDRTQGSRCAIGNVLRSARLKAVISQPTPQLR